MFFVNRSAVWSVGVREGHHHCGRGLESLYRARVPDQTSSKVTNTNTSAITNTNKYSNENANPYINREDPGQSLPPPKTKQSFFSDSCQRQKIWQLIFTHFLFPNLFLVLVLLWCVSRSVHPRFHSFFWPVVDVICFPQKELSWLLRHFFRFLSLVMIKYRDAEICR